MRTTIRETIKETRYLATWIPSKELIVLDRDDKYYATITNIPTFEDAQNYMSSWFAMSAPERH